MPTTAAAVQLEHPKNVQTLQPECSFCVCATVAFFCVLNFRGHPPGKYGEKLGNELSSSVGEKPIFL